MENEGKKIAYDFGVEAVILCKEIVKAEREYSLTDQFKRAATSIGANMSEAEYAASKADFINKLTVAMKEANESQYWLNLLHDTGYVGDEKYEMLKKKLESVLRILTASLKTAKKKNEE